MIEWKDTSNFRQDDKDRVPNEFTLWAGSFRIVVHRHIHYPKDMWLASCYPYVFDQRELKSKDIKEAQCQAVSILEVILRDALDALAEYRGNHER